MLRFRDLGASCFGLRFRVFHFETTVNLRARYGRSRVNKKLNLLNFHFYAWLSYIVSYLFIYACTNAAIIPDGGNQHPTSGDLVVAVSGAHATACYAAN